MADDGLRILDPTALRRRVGACGRRCACLCDERAELPTTPTDGQKHNMDNGQSFVLGAKGYEHRIARRPDSAAMPPNDVHFSLGAQNPVPAQNLQLNDPPLSAG